MKYFILICFLAFAQLVCGQEPPVIVQENLERMADANGTETEKDNDYLQQLDEYRRHPLPVNSASPEELAGLHLLSALQIGRLLDYRRLSGALVDLYELQAVPGWDLETIARAMPYLTVAVPMPVGRRLSERFKGGQTLLLRTGRVLQEARGYAIDSGNRYLGSRDHVLLSYKYQYKNLLYLGLTADKDPGEQFFRGAQSTGFDFYSFHFFVRNLGLIKALAVGDYVVNMGQGLLYWQSGGFGKSDAVLAIKKTALVLAPYRAAGETGFNRGLGLTLGTGKVETSIFGSYRRLGASVDTVEDRFGSIQTSGYYRTPGEIAHRNLLSQWTMGGRLAYSSTSVQLGLNALAIRYDLPQQKDAKPYNYFAFAGRQLTGFSFDYSLTDRNRHWFGEVAIDQRLHPAVLAGLLMSVDRAVDVSFLYRRLPPAYAGIGGSAFTEAALPVNEEGFYAGLFFRPATGWQVNAYADLYRFPWLRYRVNAPSTGHEYGVQVNYQPDKKWFLNLRYRSRFRQINETGAPVLAAPVGVLAQALRLQLNDQLSPRLTVKNRVELVWLKGEKGGREDGYLMYTEVSCRLMRGLRADVRVQYTETGSYDSRIYAYESDVLYSYSIPAYSGKLYRYYLDISKSIGRQLTLWVRWAESVYPGLEAIGSGLDEIGGDRRTEVKFQAVFRL